MRSTKGHYDRLSQNIPVVPSRIVPSLLYERLGYHIRGRRHITLVSHSATTLLVCSYPIYSAFLIARAQCAWSRLTICAGLHMPDIELFVAKKEATEISDGAFDGRVEVNNTF